MTICRFLKRAILTILYPALDIHNKKPCFYSQQLPHLETTPQIGNNSTKLATFMHYIYVAFKPIDV